MAADPLKMLMGEGADEAPAADEDAASDFLAAVKGGDAKALVLAFKRLKEACEGDYEDDEDEEDDEEV